MSQKIGLYIGGRRFDVDVDDEFASYLDEQIKKDFKKDGNNDVKSLVQAYVRKNYELYIQDKEMKKMIKECEDLS
jgi:predicted HD phosphohydrolase